MDFQGRIRTKGDNTGHRAQINFLSEHSQIHTLEASSSVLLLDVLCVVFCARSTVFWFVSELMVSCNEQANKFFNYTTKRPLRVSRTSQLHSPRLTFIRTAFNAWRLGCHTKFSARRLGCLQPSAHGVSVAMVTCAEESSRCSVSTSCACAS